MMVGGGGREAPSPLAAKDTILEVKAHKNNNNYHNHHHHHYPRRVGENPATVYPVGRQPPPPPHLHTLSSRYKKWFPWLVPLIVGANIVIFIAVMYVNDCPKNSDSCLGAEFLGRFSFQPFKENFLLGPSPSTLAKMGALLVDKVVKEHQGWLLISCIWLHSGVFHLLANMLSLLFIGIRLEQEFGFIRIGLVYLISGLGGSVMSALFSREQISVGASGALFGFLGGMLSELITNWTIYANKLAALTTLLLIICANLAVGILPFVDNFAHIGGFISGFFLGFVFLIRPQFAWINQRACPPGYIAPPVKSKHKSYQYVLWVVSLIVLIVGFTAGLVALFRGVDMNDHCPWCRYLSCVPTSLWSCTPPQTCVSTRFGSQLNLTCSSNGKSNVYFLAEDNSFKEQQWCSQLCK